MKAPIMRHTITNSTSSGMRSYQRSAIIKPFSAVLFSTPFRCILLFQVFPAPGAASSDSSFVPSLILSPSLFSSSLRFSLNASASSAVTVRLPAAIIRNIKSASVRSPETIATKSSVFFNGTTTLNATLSTQYLSKYFIGSLTVQNATIPFLCISAIVYPVVSSGVSLDLWSPPII